MNAPTSSHYNVSPIQHKLQQPTCMSVETHDSENIAQHPGATQMSKIVEVPWRNSCSLSTSSGHATDSHHGFFQPMWYGSQPFNNAFQHASSLSCPAVTSQSWAGAATRLTCTTERKPPQERPPITHPVCPAVPFLLHLCFLYPLVSLLGMASV